MKKIKIIMLLILISIIVQNGILYYFNNYYFVTVSTINYSKVDISTPNNNDYISIPNEASDIKISYTGNYLLYKVNKQYFVYNFITKVANKISLEQSTKNSYVNWNYYNDRVMVIENESNQFKVFNYYPDRNIKEVVLDINAKSEIYKLPQNDDTITDVKINNLNTNIYITSTKGNSSFRHLSRLDITGGVVKINTSSNNIKNYYLFKQDDNIILQDNLNNMIYCINGNKTSILDIKDILNPVLLSIDKDGKLYIGEKVNDKIEKIYISDLTKRDGKNELIYTKNIFKEPILEENIYITDSGKVFINDNLKGTLMSLNNQVTYRYKGQLLDFYKDGVLTLYNNKLLKQKISY